VSAYVCWQWCEQDSRCRRLQLTDLLISPMQRCTKVPMMLNSIRQHTEDSDGRQLLADALDKLEESLSTHTQWFHWPTQDFIFFGGGDFWRFCVMCFLFSEPRAAHFRHAF